MTTLGIPALSGQRVEGTHEAIAQSSNAHSLLQQGIKIYNAEQFAEATRSFVRAASAFGSQGDSLSQAQALRYLSLAYQHLGQWQEAESAIAQSLQLLDSQKNTNNDRAYLDVFAKAINTQGRLQWATGRLSEALETWQKAAVIYKQAGNEMGAIGSLINQAEALQALGFSSRAEAQLQTLEQILQQYREPNLKADGLQSLGKALRRVGNLRKSQEVLRQSWQVTKEFHLKQAESSALLELGNTERAFSNRAIAIGNKEDEQKHTQAAIAFYQQATSSPTFQLQAQLNLLSVTVHSPSKNQGKFRTVEISPTAH
jgi:tetratricopeptide (TPR) repeat protein